MTKAFVHGNPETSAVWLPLIEALNERGVDDIVLLSPPGFGAPVPDGFDALPASYVAWLKAAVDALDGPVDIVGHDWGAGHVMGLMAAHPESVRSWATDCIALIHPDYQWHDMAQAWQTEGAGEEAIASMLGASPEENAALYEALGLRADIAASMAQADGDAMGGCVLRLYRGAIQPMMSELGKQLVATDRPPGLMIDATDDPYAPSELARQMIEPLGISHLVLENQGHWWMNAVPDIAADGLIAFWDTLD